MTRRAVSFQLSGSLPRYETPGDDWPTCELVSVRKKLRPSVPYLPPEASASDFQHAADKLAKELRQELLSFPPEIWHSIALDLIQKAFQSDIKAHNRFAVEFK